MSGKSTLGLQDGLPDLEIGHLTYTVSPRTAPIWASTGIYHIQHRMKLFPHTHP